MVFLKYQLNHSHLIRTMFFQPVRSTVVLRRIYLPRLYKKKQTGPFRPRLNFNNYIYSLEDYLNWKPVGDMQVILAADVEGFGLKGDIVTVHKPIARCHMLPTGVAEYVTQDNLQKYENIREQQKNIPRQSLAGFKMLKLLEGMTLPVVMNAQVSWLLNKSHIQVSFRLQGIEVSEDAIVLPEDDITQPGTITIQVIVNELNTVNVKVEIYNHDFSKPADYQATYTHQEFNILQSISKAAAKIRQL